MHGGYKKPASKDGETKRKEGILNDTFLIAALRFDTLLVRTLKKYLSKAVIFIL